MVFEKKKEHHIMIQEINWLPGFACALELKKGFQKFDHHGRMVESDEKKE